MSDQVVDIPDYIQDFANDTGATITVDPGGYENVPEPVFTEGE